LTKGFEKISHLNYHWRRILILSEKSAKKAEVPLVLRLMGNFIKMLQVFLSAQIEKFIFA